MNPLFPKPEEVELRLFSEGRELEAMNLYSKRTSIPTPYIKEVFEYFRGVVYDVDR